MLSYIFWPAPDLTERTPDSSACSTEGTLMSSSGVTQRGARVMAQNFGAALLTRSDRQTFSGIIRRSLCSRGLERYGFAFVRQRVAYIVQLWVQFSSKCFQKQ